MRTWEEIEQLLADVKTASENSTAARSMAETDRAASASALEKAQLSASVAEEEHQALVAAAKAVNDALAEIITGDLGSPPTTPVSNRRNVPATSAKR